MQTDAGHPRRITALAAAAAVVLPLAGCGDESPYANTPRPPSPIVLTASINRNEVAVSPARFGAGPVNLVITNQTSAAQQITFETAGTAAGFRQRTGPINPGGTATLKADVPRGRVTVDVQGDGIQPAELTVGTERPSAQNQLLQP